MRIESIGIMVQTHKTFLIWLLYATVLLFSLGVLAYSGIPQLALSYDHSHLTLLLMALYAGAEVIAGRLAWKVSHEQRVAAQVSDWLRVTTLHGADVTAEGDGVRLTGWNSNEGPGMAYLSVPDSAVADHIRALLVKSGGTATGLRLDQRILLECTENALFERISPVEFVAARIVWIGIFATILGVIMAFWPLLQTGFDIETMKTNLGGFFGGIAVAFIPTAFSFLAKIVLDVSSKILESGVDDTLLHIARLTETSVLPLLERRP